MFCCMVDLFFSSFPKHFNIETCFLAHYNNGSSEKKDHSNILIFLVKSVKYNQQLILLTNTLNITTPDCEMLFSTQPTQMKSTLLCYIAGIDTSSVVQLTMHLAIQNASPFNNVFQNKPPKFQACSQNHSL